jgi:NADP-dependent 3-hydroxy acid dehydrogenase YdfG
MLEGKIVWITGAGTGIGLAGARALAGRGALVIMSGRRADLLESHAKEIRANGGKVETEALDVTDAAAVQRTAGDIIKRHQKVDILVNSAGVNFPNRYWRNQTVEGWNRVIRTNLDGTFYCTHMMIPHMRARKDGLVINISSWAGAYTSALVGAAYNGSKAAVIALTHTINMEECANGIRACAVCPGEVATEILDRRPVPPSTEERARMLQAEDLGETIRWVAEQPAHVCINEIVISPTWNRTYLGGSDFTESLQK